MSRSSNIIGNPDAADTTVVVDAVFKTFKVKNASGKSRLLDRGKTQSVEALRGISFAAYSGESIGILGHNGSGKSTLLRIIAGGEAATGGSVLVKSRPVLLGISAALQPHLSGARNIELGCLAMGMSPESLKIAFRDIIDFTELGDDINRPMKTYSAGMGGRLRFAIATAMIPEILIIDEALSAGDATFVAKATKRMDNIREQAGTVFMVSHSTQTILNNCGRALWMHAGEIIADDSAELVSSLYSKWSQLKASGKHHDAEDFIVERKTKYVKPRILRII